MTAERGGVLRGAAGAHVWVQDTMGVLACDIGMHVRGSRVCASQGWVIQASMRGSGSAYVYGIGWGGTGWEIAQEGAQWG